VSTGDDIGDKVLSRLLEENDEIEQQLEHFHQVGRVIGAVYNGLTREGTPEPDALELTANWMECHLFDRIDKYASIPVELDPPDVDDDSEDDK
jgi:hypothetical protein